MLTSVQQGEKKTIELVTLDGFHLSSFSMNDARDVSVLYGNIYHKSSSQVGILRKA
jgi:hypothetical protein